MRPDGPASWAIAASCCFINMMLYGMTRLSGFLFVESMDRYKAGREQASFSYTFANFFKNTSGPLVGYLGQKLGVRLVTTFGCLLAAIGVGSCFLAESVGAITLLWGVLYGLGFGLGSTLLPIKINQYFDRHRATASGISFSGACLGSFILPPIFEILEDTYGLSGTFLMLAGLVLHCVPAALLLWKPNFTIKQTNHQKHQNLDEEKKSITHGRKFKLYTVEDKGTLHNANRGSLIRKFTKSISMDSVPLKYDSSIKTLSTQTLVSSSSIRISSPTLLDGKKILPTGDGKRDSQIIADSKVSSVTSSDNSCPFIWKPTNSSLMSQPSKGQKYYNDLVGDSNSSHYTSNFDDSSANHSYRPNTNENSRIKTFSKSSSSSAFSIVYDPIFIQIAITNALYNFTFICVLTVIVDYARDIGVDEANEKYVLMSLSVGDLAGRLGLGWLTDGGYMTKTMFATWCFLGQAVTTTAIAWSTGFASLVLLVAAYGLSEAGIILIYPLIVTEFIDEDKLTVAISSSACLAGPLCLTVAPLIGYFRDELGSYKYIFSGIGLISALCSFSWLLTSCIIKLRKFKRRPGS